MKEYEFHPIADAFPLIAAPDEFNADIAKNGQRIRGTFYEGKILEGRNRYLACKAAEIEFQADELPEGADPIDFVISANIHRRHLSKSQLEAAAAELANMKQGGTGANQHKGADRPNGPSANHEGAGSENVILPSEKPLISQKEAAEKLAFRTAT